MVVAHPDDEVLGMGGRLTILQNLTLIQLTDGSPRSETDGQKNDFETVSDYASARERETLRALARLGLRSYRRIKYGFPDQEAVMALSELTEVLKADLERMKLVFTHPFEGGHPDHDAAAFAVQTACERIGISGHEPPLRFEFASYHSRSGRMITGQFWPDSASPEFAVRLPLRECARKRQALSCYRTQRDVIAQFEPDIERYRVAPRYDFSRSPPPGTALYDAFGWSMTARVWRQYAQVAASQLGPAR